MVIVCFLQFFIVFLSFTFISTFLLHLFLVLLPLLLLYSLFFLLLFLSSPSSYLLFFTLYIPSHLVLFSAPHIHLTFRDQYLIPARRARNSFSSSVEPCLDTTNQQTYPPPRSRVNPATTSCERPPISQNTRGLCPLSREPSTDEDDVQQM